MGLRDRRNYNLGFKVILAPFRFQGVLEYIRSKIVIERTVYSYLTLNLANGLRFDLEQLRNIKLLVGNRTRIPLINAIR